MPVSHKGKNIVKKTKTKTKTKTKLAGGGSKNKSRRSSRSRRSSNNNKQKKIINDQNDITIEYLIRYFVNETIEEFNLDRSKDIKDQLMKINFPTLNQLLYDLSIIKLNLYDKLIKGTYTYKTGNTLIYSGYTKNINDFITDYKFIVNFTGYVYEFDDESSYRSYKHVNSTTDPLSYNDIMEYMTKYNFDKKKVENSIKRWQSFGAKKITVDNIDFKNYALSHVPRWFTENYVLSNRQSYYNYLKEIYFKDIGESEDYKDFLASLRSDEIDKEEKELLSSNV